MAISIIQGDAMAVLRGLPDASVNCCITSPPYWGLRDYGMAGQIGMEKTPDEFVANLVAVFSEVRRVLTHDGTCWVNLGDSYANDGKWGGSTGGKHVTALHDTSIGRGKRNTGLKPKDLVGIPWRVAFALQADGWYLRQDIIWHKPNPMPESVKDRCTKAHEYVFMLTKSASYYFDSEAMSEPCVKGAAGSKTATHQLDRTSTVDRVETEMRNRRSVWTMATRPCREAHFATFPIDLPRLCMQAGCPVGGIVLDPFAGAGTTALACVETGRNFQGIELRRDYIGIANGRIARLVEELA